MAINLAQGDILRVAILSHNIDQLGINVLHYRFQLSSGTVTDAQAATAFNAVFPTADYRACMAADAKYWGFDLQKIFPLPVAAVQQLRTAGLAGTGGADSAPRQACGILTKTSALAGRANRGRMYFPFPSDDLIDATGHATAAYKNSMALVATVVLASITVAPGGGNVGVMDPIIFHTAFPATITPITGFTVRTKIATQRRRGDYGAVNPIP